MLHTTLDRFWAKVNKQGPVPPKHPELSPCWLWAASDWKGGHGQFWDGKAVVAAHRFSKSLVCRVPEDRDVHHICEVPRCVNPDHLQVVSQSEHDLKHDRGPSTGACGLSRREVEVLQYICQGNTPREIGQSLGISPLTVDVHWTNIRKKTGIGKATLLVRFAIREGLVAA